MAQEAKRTTERRTLEITPAAILWEGILMLPIVGTVDSKRAQEIMQVILDKIEATSARVVILDILGVPVIDSSVANHLVKITKATRLMGADCILSGISPAIAQILVHLGVELGDVITKGNLMGAVEFAFETLNLEVREVKESSKKKGGS